MNGLSAENRRKRRLRVQNRSAGCLLSSIKTSRQQKVHFELENNVYQFRVLPFGLNTAPQVFTRLGHTVAAYLHRQGISVIPFLDNWLMVWMVDGHPDHQVLLLHQSQLLHTLNIVGLG